MKHCTVAETILKISVQYQRNDDKCQSAKFPPMRTKAKHTAADAYEDTTPQSSTCYEPCTYALSSDVFKLLAFVLKLKHLITQWDQRVFKM